MAPHSLWVMQPECHPGLPVSLCSCLSRLPCCLKTPQWTWDLYVADAEVSMKHKMYGRPQKQPGGLRRGASGAFSLQVLVAL